MSSPRERWGAVDTVMAGLIGLLQNYITITRHAAWVRLAIGPAPCLSHSLQLAIRATILGSASG